MRVGTDTKDVYVVLFWVEATGTFQHDIPCPAGEGEMGMEIDKIDLGIVVLITYKGFQLAMHTIKIDILYSKSYNEDNGEIEDSRLLWSHVFLQ